MSDKDMTERSELNTPKKTKLANILKFFLSGRSLNRLDAEHHHDQCLNTTISTLQNGQGIVIDQQRKTVHCVRGTSSVSVSRYWLNNKPDKIKRAHDLLAKLERTI